LASGVDVAVRRGIGLQTKQPGWDLRSQPGCCFGPTTAAVPARRPRRCPGASPGAGLIGLHGPHHQLVVASRRLTMPVAWPSVVEPPLVRG